MVLNRCGTLQYVSLQIFHLNMILCLGDYSSRMVLLYVSLCRIDDYPILECHTFWVNFLFNFLYLFNAYRQSCIAPQYAVLDAHRDKVMIIQGPTCMCQGPCCAGDVEFKVIPLQ